MRKGRGRPSSRDDSELSRRQKSGKRNSSLVSTARLSMGDFILSTTGIVRVWCHLIMEISAHLHTDNLYYHIYKHVLKCFTKLLSASLPFQDWD